MAVAEDAFEFGGEDDVMFLALFENQFFGGLAERRVVAALVAGEKFL